MILRKIPYWFKQPPLCMSVQRTRLWAAQGIGCRRSGRVLACQSRQYATNIELSIEELDKQAGGSHDVPLDMLSSDIVQGEKGKNSAMIRYIKTIMDKYPDSVVLTQVGSFFEIYLHQAVEFGPKMNLKIARKSQISPFPDIAFINMAGFPCYQLDRYVKILVQNLKKSVVLMEQCPDLNSDMTEEEKRPITRIITPGTLVGDTFLDSSRNNYLAAVEFTNHQLTSPPDETSPVAVAWADLSVGSFYFQSTTLGDLMSDLARIKPNEILLDSAIRKYRLEEGEWYDDLAELRRYFYSYRQYPAKEDFKYYADLFADSKAIVAYTADIVQDKELSAMTAILEYIRETLPDTDLKLELPKEQLLGDILKMDSRSQEALELFQASNSDTIKGSLINVIRRTVSSSGTRLLSHWLSYPLVDIHAIEERQNFVSYFYSEPALTEDLVDILKNTDDSERTLQRMKLKKIDPLDILTMASCIDVMKSTYDRLNRDKTLPDIFSKWIAELGANLRPLSRISSRIRNSLDINAIIAKRRDEEEILASGTGDKPAKRGMKKDGTETKAILQPNASPTLVELYDSRNDFDIKKQELEAKFKQLCQHLPVKVAVRWSPMLLYHVNIKLDNKGGPTIEPYVKDIKIDGAILNQTKKTLCIQNGEWTSLGIMKDRFQERVQAEEERIIKDLRAKLLGHSKKITICSNILDQMDVLLSFASLAKEQHLVRPTLDNSCEIDIQEGSHITVASGLLKDGALFTSNDCRLNCSESNGISIITGPNMGGKSTFLRQVALNSILAQIGCFVPASHARVGIVDRIFCRVGAGDDLYRGRSTFMVEMLETGNILKHATDRSLAILDEVGRGTSSSDGLSLAYATLYHLLHKNKCRTLFATHFGGELWDLLKENEQERQFNYYHTDVTVRDGEIVFDHKMKPGICSDSHGLDVAELAGFPSEVLQKAREVSKLQKHMIRRRDIENKSQSPVGMVAQGYSAVVPKRVVFA